MSLKKCNCPDSGSDSYRPHTTYTVTSGEERTIYQCQDCYNYFSETKNTPLARLKTPLSRMTLILDAVNDGMGLNAAGRTFHVSKNSIKRWLGRLGGLKETLLLYALAQVIERTDDLTLFTDGERRYGNLLFEICQEVIQTGQVGRPKNTQVLGAVCAFLAFLLYYSLGYLLVDWICSSFPILPEVSLTTSGGSCQRSMKLPNREEIYPK